MHSSSFSSIEPAYRRCLSPREFDLVPEEVPDVLDPVLDHRGPLEAEAPSDHSDIGGETHGGKHLGPEHAGVSNLGPLLEVGVVSEDLHGGFCVGVEGWFKPELGDSNFLEESLDGSDEVAETEVVVRDETLDLVELAKVGCVHALVPEDSVDTARGVSEASA